MKAKLNPMFVNVSGKLGDLVFREVQGKIVVSRKPTNTAAPSSKQAEHRERFKNAVAYSRSVLDSEELRERYAAAAKERNLSFNAVMVADYFHAPVVVGLELHAFKGQAGDVFNVIATDDFAVANVHVKIINEQGEVVESGLATQVSDNMNYWSYIAKTALTSNFMIEVIAMDHPGGVAVRQFPFPKPF